MNEGRRLLAHIVGEVQYIHIFVYINIIRFEPSPHEFIFDIILKDLISIEIYVDNKGRRLLTHIVGEVQCIHILIHIDIFRFGLSSHKFIFGIILKDLLSIKIYVDINSYLSLNLLTFFFFLC